MIAALRIMKFVLCLFGLGWSLGMLRAYWHLWRAGTARERRTWVPGSMVFVMSGIVGMLVAILWSQVTQFHRPLTGTSIINYFAVALLDIGLVRMQSGLSNREHDRQDDYGKSPW